ncbi:hypothetical protein [Paraburkholderia sp.]|uniref:hypothetical protein n=1 Tax=Paraburkholderia sp. TaxID=1926495 RepID=UPI002397AA3F|nr:hypothetical protein [Paraburkholderia sp.]MDE1180248.1 hypothetical protein [Paraburkholderia sp.]
MNLNEQIGALEMGIDQLIDASDASRQPESAVHPEALPADPPVESPAAALPEEPVEAAPAAMPTLAIARPAQDEITMTIGDQTVRLHTEQIGQLIEELANARASMQPEPPPNVPPGWRFVSTKNPAMAVQKSANGDRLLILRHTGHGWVPFTLSPEVAVQLYMLLTQG